MKEDNVPVIQETAGIPSNVIDITTRKRAGVAARPNAQTQHRPNLQLVQLAPTELPAA